MLRKIILACLLTAGLATTTAMAQSMSGSSSGHGRHAHDSYGTMNEEQMLDQTTTGSIVQVPSTNAEPSEILPGGIGPCAYDTPGPDANTQLGVNDHYCGK